MTGRRGPNSPDNLEEYIRRTLKSHFLLMGLVQNEDGSLGPTTQTKDNLRYLHSEQRKDRLIQNRRFIEQNGKDLLNHLASGFEVNPRAIEPIVQPIKGDTLEADLFRFASLTWSVPVSNGYGRRMRFLVWDKTNNKLIGIIGLGDPVFNLKVRDLTIGWDGKRRREALVNVMDAYVLGALPPYNKLLGGKLIACLTRTKEIKNAFYKRYHSKEGIISHQKKSASLVAITTSSALGRSTVYDRLKLEGRYYFESIGYTSGWGHFHIPSDLFELMRQFLKIHDHPYSANNRFGQGPNWRLRTVRAVLSLLSMDPNMLHHGILREVFISRLAMNADRVLRGESTRPIFSGLRSVEEVSELAKDRWLIPRSQRRPDYLDWKREQILELIDPSKVGSVILDNHPSTIQPFVTQSSSKVITNDIVRSGKRKMKELER